jgi:hypothetical protein
VKWEDKPNLKRWFEAISERPAVQRAIEKVNAIKSSRDVATDEHKDRFFGRDPVAPGACDQITNAGATGSRLAPAIARRRRA